MRKRINILVMLLYVGIMLTCFTACSKQELPQESTEVVAEASKEQIDLLKTGWLNSQCEAKKTDSWSVEKYTDNLLPQMKDGVLGTRLYALDNNLFWTWTEIWKNHGDGNKSREYQLTKYDMDLEEYETSLYALKWNESITGFDNLIQGMEQLTFHIVGMDCVDGIFSLLVEGSDEERKAICKEYFLKRFYLNLQESVKLSRLLHSYLSLIHLLYREPYLHQERKKVRLPPLPHLQV